MAETLFYNFKHVALLDAEEKSVQVTSCCMNIKNLVYTNKEVEELQASYRNALCDNMITEFELIVTQRPDYKKLNPNSFYKINIFDRKVGMSTYFTGLVTKLERTHKESQDNCRYFYTGVRIGRPSYDGLNIFSFYSPKILIACKNNSSEIIVCKPQSEIAEAKFIHDKLYSDYKFYNISEAMINKKVAFESGESITVENFS